MAETITDEQKQQAQISQQIDKDALKQAAEQKQQEMLEAAQQALDKAN